MDDPNKPQISKFQEVILVLQQKGWSQDQIAELTTELQKSAFNQFYVEAMAAFTDDDFDQIEKIEDESAAQQKVKELYQERTGKNPDEEASKFFDVFADGFLKENSEHPED